jgi:hypothetical protein
MKNDNKSQFDRAEQAPLWGSVASATVFIDLPARFPSRPPATYHVKVENTYRPQADSSGSAAQAAFRLAQPARS